jgi:hypothetical protein
MVSTASAACQEGGAGSAGLQREVAYRLAVEAQFAFAEGEVLLRNQRVGALQLRHGLQQVGVAAQLVVVAHGGQQLPGGNPAGACRRIRERGGHQRQRENSGQTERHAAASPCMTRRQTRFRAAFGQEGMQPCRFTSIMGAKACCTGH